jgi:cytochrome c peroxidase
VKQGKDTFTSQEFNGYLLFKKNCNACHTEPLFTNGGFANNGLQLDSILKDRGRWQVTHQAADDRLFKIPTLRNIAYTYPYMHDGRFNKLSQVMQHYNSGIERSNTLHPFLKHGLQLGSNDRVDLVSFLLTLSDKDFVLNSKYLPPTINK